MTFKLLNPAEVYELIKSGREVALLDVREQGKHAEEGHPLFAAPFPLSKIELLAAKLLPRKSAQIVLLDQGGDDDLARRASVVLETLGYCDISIMQHGVLGWHQAGYEVFTGVNVPSKAFGEFVEHECATPHISAADLHGRLAVGEKIAIFDSRPFSEYNRMCIPGGVDMPGAELVYRIASNVEDETTPIVVNCAGRTRSIIGAQSLRNAGIKNPVMALKDGTMGWYLAGFDVEKGAERIASAPAIPDMSDQISSARSFAERAGATKISVDELQKLLDEQKKKTTYLLDVRTAEEYEVGHVEGSQHAPGGQLVQATDEYVAVRSSRLILIDDVEVRAWMTASWLCQMGWDDVFVFSDLKDVSLLAGPSSEATINLYQTLSAMELDAVIQSGETIAILDFSTSLEYRQSHIPGACWMIRSRIERDTKLLPPIGLIIVTAEDERMAHLAAPEVLQARPQAIVRVLAGGNGAWRQSEFDVEQGDTRQLSPPDDVWYKPYDNKEKVKERMQEYLDWEVGLISQIKRDATATFKIIAQ